MYPLGHSQRLTGVYLNEVLHVPPFRQPGLQGSVKYTLYWYFQETIAVYINDKLVYKLLLELKGFSNGQQKKHRIK